MQGTISKEKWESLHTIDELDTTLKAVINKHFHGWWVLPWVRKGYKDYYVDGFHFGYKIETMPSGEKVVVVYEACHELLFF